MLPEIKQCYGTREVEQCKLEGGECSTITEGFFILSMACLVIGCVWFVWGWRTMRQLQNVEVSKWRVVKKDEKVAADVKEDGHIFKYFYCF